MTTLSELVGTKWAGTSELWLDPLGDQVQRAECNIEIQAQGVLYTWSYEGKPQTGNVTLTSDGAQFVDTWHQPTPMECTRLVGVPGLFQVQGEYGPGWGWRIALSLRPDSRELVLQMTNICPWGEEARAVRMICTNR